MGNCQTASNQHSVPEQAREGGNRIKVFRHDPKQGDNKNSPFPIQEHNDDLISSSLTCGLSLTSESSFTVHPYPQISVTPFTATSTNSTSMSTTMADDSASNVLPQKAPCCNSTTTTNWSSERKKLSITPEESDQGGSNHSTNSNSSSLAGSCAKPLETTCNPAMDSVMLCGNDHDELGAIHFQYTSLTDALQHAERCQKPIFCIEADIPGDAGCGSNVLAHPLVVEAAETYFVTTVIINPPLNVDSSISISSCSSARQQQQRRCLHRCRTRLRIYEATGIREISNCGVDGNDVMSVAGVIDAIISALDLYKLEIPRYLQLLQEEESGRWCQSLPMSASMPALTTATAQLQRRVDRQAIFGVSDVAQGEVEFAVLYGVLAVKAGQLDQQKVVQVTYDSTRLCYCNLLRHAFQRNVADVIYYQNNEERMGARMEAVAAGKVNPKLVECAFLPEHPVQDPKHYLRTTMLRYVPLTDLQAMRANHLVYKGVFNEAMRLLSPRQGVILMQVIRNGNRKHLRDVVDVPIACAWKSVTAALQS